MLKLISPLSILALALCHALLTVAGTPAKRASSDSDILSFFQSKSSLADSIKGAMLGSIRTSWEQGTAANGILEIENPEYSIFASDPFVNHSTIPVGTLRLAFSAAVRQTSDGRLSQNIGDGEDGAALDGASAAPYTMLGAFTDSHRAAYFETATYKELNFLLNSVPRMQSGALSMRVDTHQYWDDGVYMGPPFLAYYGAVSQNQTLLQLAYDNCRLYRNALLINGSTGPLWAHIYDEDTASWTDEGLWATGNAWAALGMIRVQSTIMKSAFASEMSTQISNLQSWVKQVLDGTFAAIGSDDLIPNYIDSNSTFGDASSSAALASVAFRAAVIDPDTFGSNYTSTALTLATAVLSSVDELGVISPYVDPLIWTAQGELSTEGQSFALMLLAAIRDYLNANGESVSIS